MDYFGLDYDKFNELLEKTQQFMFLMIYPELWNNDQIIQTSKIIKSEAKNDFYSSVVNIRQIEMIARLIKILKHDNLNSTNMQYANAILQNINTFVHSICINSIPKSKKKVENLINLLIEA